MNIFTLRTLFVVSAALFTTQQAFALPTIEGVSVISSKRLDRTVFEYSISLKVRGDSSHYKGVLVDVGGGGKGTKITKSLVSVGDVDADTSLRTKDILIVNHDRAFPFDASKFTFRFSALDTAYAVNQASATRIGSVQFYEIAGRPMHTGSFPIQSENPLAGSNLLLKANIFGPTNSVEYRLLNTKGQLLLSIPMSAVQNDQQGTAYITTVPIPNEPFSSTILATTPSGQVVTWASSKITEPSVSTLKFRPVKALLKKGESTSVSIEFNPGSSVGPFVVSLALPAGFGGVSGPWIISPSTNTTTLIDASIIAPTTGGRFDEYSLSVQAFPQSNPSQVVTSSLRFLVK